MASQSTIAVSFFFTWCKMFVLLQLLTQSLCQEPEFDEQPSREAVLEGRPATMKCRISNLANNDIVLWYRSDVLISNGTVIVGHNLDTSRYAIMVNKNSGQYNFHIAEASRVDAHNYRCSVQRIGVPTLKLSSHDARLDVYHLPGSNYPECLALSKPSFHEEEEITIECKSERANPPVSMNWKRNGEVISQVIFNDQVPGFRSLLYTFRADSSLQGAIFECSLTSDADDSYNPHCSTTALNILYAPRVTLERITETVVVDQEVMFECNADAYPEPSHYIWKRAPELPAERIKFSHNKTQMMITPRLSDNGTTITCNVTNSVGSTSASVIMIVLPEPPQTTTPKTNSTLVTVRPKISTDVTEYKPDVGSSASETVPLSPEILAIIIGIIGLLILIVLVITLGYLCRCFPVQHKGTYDGSVYGSTFGPNYGPTERPIWDQTSIYFEPKDHLRELNTWQRTNRPVWQRNVSVQVPHVEEEPPYQEIGQDWDDGTYTMQI